MVNVTICVDAGVKLVDLSTAINVFLRKSIHAGGFPFDVRLDERLTPAAAPEPSELSQHAVSARGAD